MADILVTTKVTKPGVYIGRVNRPAPSGLTGFARLPAFVGRGNRLRTMFNNPIRRSYLYDVFLSFPTVAPHIIALAEPALNDQNISVLFRSDGIVVPVSKWRFLESTPGSGIFDAVLLSPEVHALNVSYNLNYQSTSRGIRDELPFDELREMRFVGNTENQELYQEFIHYFVPIAVTSPAAGVTNSHSASSAEGFEPAQITSTIAGPYTFVGGETFNPRINGVTFPVVFPAGVLSTAQVVALINAAVPALEGAALNLGSSFITVRSANADPSVSVVAIQAGTANTILGTIGAQFPSGPMALASYTTAGYVRKVSGTGSPVVGIGSTSSSNHDYNRRYQITFSTPGVTVPATIRVLLDSGSSLPAVTPGGAITIAGMFGGTSNSNVQPQLPFHSSLPATGVTVSFPNPAGVSIVNFTDITGDVVTFILDNTGGPITGGEVYEVTAVGPSIIQVDSAVTNTVQHASFSAVGSSVFVQTGVAPNYATSVAGALTGTGSVSLRADSQFTGSANRRYALICTASAGAPGSRSATFAWQAWGEIPDLLYNGSSRLFTVSEASSTNASVNLGDGVLIALSFGASNFAVNNIFWFQGNAERLFVTAKDDRSFILDVAAVGVSGANNLVTFQYQTGTPEGGFNLIQVTGAAGQLFLPGGVRLWVRNLGSQTTTANRFAINDQWTFDTVCEDAMDWSLTTLTTETVDPTQIYTDTLGVITGTTGLRYLVLNDVPANILYIRDTVTGALITSYSIPSTSQPYIAFVSAPVNPIAIRYETQGLEPAPSSLYYVTANTLRPLSAYNNPTRTLSYEEAAQLLGPSATSNDLLIAAELALQDNNAPGAYFCQARDSDGDGFVTSVDINAAIIATENERNLTDVIVLSTFNSLSTALSNNEKMNDPFERGERALWVGAPIGTAIGNTSTPGTLVFLATKTLQVYGENPAHGKRVMIGNVEAVKTITLTNGTQVDVRLDGSFVAAAIAARNASFSDPGETLLRKNLFGFKSVVTFSEPQQLQLIGAGIIFVSNVGDATTPVFRIEESTTVDRSSDDNNEISVAINQKEFTTREIRTQMDNALVSILPPSEQAGVAIIQTYLVGILTDLVARGIIGPYTDESGNARPLDPDEDVKVFRAKNNRTAYNFQYWWNARYPIKRLFGLYSVDRKFFGDQV